MPNEGSLSIRHNFTGESQNVIMRWYKSTAPLTELGRVVYPAPHVEESYIIDNLQPVWHLIEFWRSADGSTLDELLLTLAGNARSGAVYPLSIYEYVVNRGQSEVGVWADPVQNDIGIRDTRLQNMFYWVQERGTGDLLAAEYIDRSDVGGGFDFVQDGKVMNDGGVYIVKAMRRIDIIGDSGSGVADSSEDGIFILDVDQDYVHADMNGKTLISDFSTDVGELTMPNLALLPDAVFELQTHQGMQRNVVVQLDAGDLVWFRGTQRNKIVLGIGEEIEFLIKDNVLYVLNHNTNHFRLGQRMYADTILLNSLPCDGTLLAHADYPRVQELIDSLPAGGAVGETTWNTSSTAADGQTVYANKGKWMSEGANFRPPDLRSLAIKSMPSLIPGTAGGTYDHQATLEHYHNIASGQDGGSPYLAGGHSTGGNLGYAFNGSNTVPNSYRSGPARSGSSDIGSSQQKINSILLYPLVCI